MSLFSFGLEKVLNCMQIFTEYIDMYPNSVSCSWEVRIKVVMNQPNQMINWQDFWDQYSLKNVFVYVLRQKTERHEEMLTWFSFSDELSLLVRVQDRSSNESEPNQMIHWKDQTLKTDFEISTLSNCLNVLWQKESGMCFGTKWGWVNVDLIFVLYELLFFVSGLFWYCLVDAYFSPPSSRLVHLSCDGSRMICLS